MSKGRKTKDRILEKAAGLASVCGLEEMTIGKLAETTGMSKSGLFAHFNSKENLQAEVVQWVGDMFTDEVLTPAFGQPRGIPRIRALFDAWRDWIDGDSLPGGCVMIASSVEFDDRPGAVRDEVVDMMKKLLELLTRTAQIAMEEGHFKSDSDPVQFAFEFQSLMHGYHLLSRLLQDPSARERSNAALEKLLSAYEADSFHTN